MAQVMLTMAFDAIGSKLGLYSIEQIEGQDTIMLARIMVVLVANLADINPVGQQMAQRAAGPRDAAAA